MQENFILSVLFLAVAGAADPLLASDNSPCAVVSVGARLIRHKDAVKEMEHIEFHNGTEKDIMPYKMINVRVQYGCHLELFDQPNFKGMPAKLVGRKTSDPTKIYTVYRSARCTCKYLPIWFDATTTSTTTAQPQVSPLEANSEDLSISMGFVNNSINKTTENASVIHHLPSILSLLAARLLIH